MLEPGKLSDQTLSDNEFITFQKFSQKSPKGHNFSNLQLAQHWPRITLEPIQEYALRVNTTHKNARERPGTSRGSPGTSAQQPLKPHKIIIFITPGGDTIRVHFHWLLMLISITETSSEHDFDIRTGKIIRLEPRKQWIHYFSIFFAKFFKRS